MKHAKTLTYTLREPIISGDISRGVSLALAGKPVGPSLFPLAGPITVSPITSRMEQVPGPGTDIIHK